MNLKMCTTRSMYITYPVLHPVMYITSRITCASLEYERNFKMLCIIHVIYLHKASVSFQVGTFASYCIRCRLKVGFKIQYISRQL